jgi:hypothetical protein
MIPNNLGVREGEYWYEDYFGDPSHAIKVSSVEFYDVWQEWIVWLEYRHPLSTVEDDKTLLRRLRLSTLLKKWKKA